MRYTYIPSGLAFGDSTKNFTNYELTVNSVLAACFLQDYLKPGNWQDEIDSILLTLL